MNIKLGLNIIFDKDIYSAIDFASKNKFSSIEVWLVAPQFLPGKYSRKERVKIARYSQSKNVQIQLHAPEDLSFFMSYPEVSRASLDYYKNMIDFAKDIKAITFTIHPGGQNAFTFPGGKTLPLSRFYPKYFLKMFRENLGIICDYAKGKTQLCIENTNYFEEPIMKVIEKLLRKGELFLTWDIAKSYNKNGSIKKQEVNFFLRNLKNIKNVHLHDATSLAGHEIIGKGFVDFKFFLKKLKGLDVNYIIEIRPHSNVLKSRDNLLRILK